MELEKQIEIIENLIEATRELNGEYQEGWDEEIEQGEKLLDWLSYLNSERNISSKSADNGEGTTVL